MKDLKIGVVGGGVVGRATARTYLEHVAEVRVYDIVKERSTHPLTDVLKCDLVFVCLPTPQEKDGLGCDTGYVDRFFGEVSQWGGDVCHTNFVLRSTVPIGTTRDLGERYQLPNLVHSPEFLTARVAATDAHLPARNVVGRVQTSDQPGACQNLLRRLYERRFPAIPVHEMMSDESEAVKLIQNSFFAVKVAFFNEVRWLADRLGLDWGLVLGAVLADGRIAHSHTNVPGPDGMRGFGGTCLPKDLANLVKTMLRNGLMCPVLEGALERNLRDREGRPWVCGGARATGE